MSSHVVKYNGGDQTAEISSRKTIDTFLGPLSRFNGHRPWNISLAPLPPDKTYGEMLRAGELSTEYIQAAGSADAMTIEIRIPGGQQWGAQWVRYTVGHDHSGGDEPYDVAIELPNSVKMVKRSQVFDADEAAELFFAYYKTGSIPPSYALDPIEGYTPDGGYIDLLNGVKLETSRKRR